MAYGERVGVGFNGISSVGVVYFVLVVRPWSFYPRGDCCGGFGLVLLCNTLFVFACARGHTTLALCVPSGLRFVCLVAVVCSPAACGSLPSVSRGFPSYHHFLPLGLPTRYALIPSFFRSAVLVASFSSCVPWRCPHFLRRWRQLLREPQSVAARAHRWLTAAEGDHPPPPPRPDKDFVASLRVVNGTLECPPQESPHPYQDLPGGFSRHLQDALFPPWIIGRGSMTAWEARIVGEEWAREWSRWCAATRAPETPAQRYAAIPLKGWGPDGRPRPTMIRGAGPDHPWDAATGEWLQAAPGPQTGWTGDVSSLVRTPVPPRIVLHAANVLRATEIRTWRHAAATVRWHPPEDGATQLTVAHFKAGGPVYDDALSRLGDTQGPLLLMLPIGIAAALRQELGGCEGLRVGWEAVADGTLLALLHRDTANGCQWDALTPHLTGRHVYMASPPQGHPRLAWDDLIAAFHDHGILPDDTWQEVQRKTLGKDYRRRVRARLLEIRDPL